MTKWEKWLDRFCYFTFLLVLLYGAFESGRYFEAITSAEKVEKVQLNCLKDKMIIYGKDYFFFQDKGQNYFVKKSVDLDNKKKWIKVK